MNTIYVACNYSKIPPPPWRIALKQLLQPFQKNKTAQAALKLSDQLKFTLTLDKAIQQKEIVRDFTSFIDAKFQCFYFLQAIWSTHPKNFINIILDTVNDQLSALCPYLKANIGKNNVFGLDLQLSFFKLLFTAHYKKYINDRLIVNGIWCRLVSAKHIYQKSNMPRDISVSAPSSGSQGKVLVKAHRGVKPLEAL